ncbi:GDSL-type esterase/lipase family protein [Myxococcota bacterium]|nr:GDSL-type esterase/lipase family protein [Myxococcota bacterium]
MSSRLIGWLGPAALVCLSLMFSFSVMEIAVRSFHPAPIRWVYPQEFYDFDPEIAHTLRPLQRSYTHDKPVSINSLGIRDREFSESPEAGTTRILAIGDSQTFGNGLNAADTWPKQLERELEIKNDPQGVRWEVLNGGIPGTDTWQHERWLGRMMDLYHPEIVVLAFYVNDVSPTYSPQQRGSAKKSNTLVNRVGYLLKRSAVVSLALQRLSALEHSEQSKQGRAFEDYILTGEFNERVERGWTQVTQSLKAMKATTDSKGADFILAILPRRDQVAGILESNAYNRRIAAIATEARIHSVDLLTELKQGFETDGQSLFIRWDGHNSAQANKLVAQRISKVLLSKSAHHSSKTQAHEFSGQSAQGARFSEPILEVTHRHDRMRAGSTRPANPNSGI